MLAMFSGALFVLALIYGLFLMIKDRNVTKKKLKRMTDNRLLTAVSNWLFHYYREGLEEPELLVQIPDVQPACSDPADRQRGNRLRRRPSAVGESRHGHVNLWQRSG